MLYRTPAPRKSTPEEIEDRVAAGADLLDQLDPTWAWRIDLSTLVVSDSFWYGNRPQGGCVVMQVTDMDFRDGLKALGLYPTFPKETPYDVGLPLGFCVVDPEEYDATYWAWVEEVLNRRPTVLVGGEATHWLDT